MRLEEGKENRVKSSTTHAYLLCCLLSLLWGIQANAGGGGVLTEDRCVVEMGFMEAHLTIYQPQTRASEKFCDAVPDLTDTVFVLDYLHDSLNEAPIEFRIIEDVTGLGRFARWRDIEDLENIERVTVYHQPATLSPGGSLQVEHRFQETGDYLLLVTAGHPGKDKRYHAVAPLAVGSGRLIFWLALIVAVGLSLAVIAYLVRRREQ